ncbi:hypothetical protein BV20DRAFT_1113176 [Pilatotrama ljubarskyi]|nr:hypothetical protein BV20DRAFT_1113176 [Pilatotrama ljubarskyi]
MTSKKPSKVLKAPDKPPKHKKSHGTRRSQVAARPPSATKENETPVSQTQEGRRIVTVHWSKPEYHFVTDLLLSAIEEHPPTCIALGFDPGEKDGSSKMNGKVIHEHYTRLARKVFLESGRFTKYTEDDIEELAGVIKNRVIRIKAIYRECRTKLTDTGAGLVDEDREDVFEEGSQLANIWDAIKREFPWYKHVNQLMRGHPLVDRSGVANSTTEVDLTILDRKQENLDGRRNHYGAQPDRHSADPLSVSPASSRDDPEYEPRGGSSSATATAPSTGTEDEGLDNSSSDSDETNVVAKSVGKRKRPSTTSSVNTSMSKRRKTMLQHVQELAAADREARLKQTRMHLYARHKYKLEKEKIRCDLERARLEHEARERDKQRAHELKLMEAQIELERIRRGMAPISPPLLTTVSSNSPADAATH